MRGSVAMPSMCIKQATDDVRHCINIEELRNYSEFLRQ